MYRILKWLVWIAGIFFVFIVVAIIAVQIFLSSDEIIRIAEREGRTILGRKVSIERLELGLFKIEASGVVIDEKTGKGEAKDNIPFARFDNVEILLNPSALIYKRLSILQLTVNNAFVRVRRDANGRFTFQDIIDNLNWGASQANPARTEITLSLINIAEATESALEGNESGFSFIVHELDLHNVIVELGFEANETTPAFESSCSFAHIAVDKIKPGEPFDIFLDGKCRESDGQQLIHLKGDAHINANEQSFRASFEMPQFDSSFLSVVASDIEGFRLRKGVFAGNVRFAYIAREPITWDLDLNGQAIDADFQLDRRGKWRSLAFSGLKLKTKGRFDPLDNSTRIETFLLETPFLNMKLTKPSFWNVSARDEVHLEVNIRDMREAGGLISKFSDIPLQKLKNNATARVLVSVKRDRSTPEEFFHVELDSHFDPVDISLFREFIPTGPLVSRINGNIGGDVRVVFLSGDLMDWDVTLSAQDLGANMRMDKSEQWKSLVFESAVLHSVGNFDLKSESAQINTMEIKLPFASAKLLGAAKWNVDGNDEASFAVQIRDVSMASNLAKRLGLVSLGDIPGNTKFRLNAAMSRSRKNSSAFKISMNTSFDSLPLASLAELITLPPNVQKVFGRLNGELQLAALPDGPLRWKATVIGRQVSAWVRIDSMDKPRRVTFESIGLKSSGFYLASKGSAEIQTLDFNIPFARAYLNRKALWNLMGKDEFSMTLDVTDLSAAEVWLGNLVAQSIKPGQKNERLKITLSGTRHRKDGRGFSYQGSASFDPIHISPLVKFISLQHVYRNPVGEVGGKITFSYYPGIKMDWSLGLTSEDMKGDFFALVSREWRRLRTGKFRIETAGSYDFKNQTGKLQRLNLNMPFGYVEILRPVAWNASGLDSGRFQWKVSSLEGATRFAGGIWGEPVSEFLLTGAAKGVIEITNKKKKSQSVFTQGSFAANLTTLGHKAYPNLNVTASISGQLNDDVVKLQIPTLKTVDSSKPGSEPSVILQNMSASLDRSSILQGKIRSQSVRLEQLSVRYVRHEQGTTNFSSLFKKEKVKETKTRHMNRQGKSVTAAKRTTPDKPREAENKAHSPLFPAVKIAKFEVAKLKFYFQDFIAADKPPVTLGFPEASLAIRNLDTLMEPGLRKTRLELRALGQSPYILVKANLNPGSAPPDADGIFKISRFDLRKISPYLRDSKGESASALLMRGTEITRGRLDFKSTYSLRNSQLELDGKAKIIGLRLKPDEKFPLADLVVKLLKASVFRLFERPDDTISLNVRVTGRLDDPDFHILGAIVEPMFLGLFEKAQNLGGNVKGIITGILGTAIGGVQKLIPKPESGRTPPKKGSGEKTDAGKNRLEKLGNELEQTLKKGLQGLFGVK